MYLRVTVFVVKAISQPMIQFGEISELTMMFLLFSYLDHGRSCSAKLEYFLDCACLGTALQESLEEGYYKADYPTDGGGIYPVFSKPCITAGCRHTMRTF